MILGQELRVPQMAAHYRVEENKETKERTLITFSIESQSSTFPFTSNKAAFYEWNEDGTEKKRSDFDVPNAMFGFFHDILVTENWYCLFQNPTSLDFQKLMTNTYSPSAALQKRSPCKKEKANLVDVPENRESEENVEWDEFAKSYELKNQFSSIT